MMRGRVIAVAATLALAAPWAGAQQSAAGIFKGKVAEGLYEVKSEIDLTGVPGVPRDKQKSSESRSRCVTRAEIDQGISAGADCSVTKYTEAGSTTRVLMACKDGRSSDMKYTFSKEGFASETTTTGKEDGKAFVSVFRARREARRTLPRRRARGQGTGQVAATSAPRGSARGPWGPRWW
jgi:hypothetical protein